MIAPVTKESKPGEIPVFLLIVFGTSWILWIARTLLKVREDLLFFGSAGPTVGAVVMLLRGTAGKSLLQKFRIGLFLALIPMSWALLVLSNAARAGFRSFDSSAILIFPALLPALGVTFFVSAGELRWSGARWPIFAVLSMPVFLVVPAVGAYFLGLPIVHPGNGQPAVALAVAAVSFAKQLIFTGFFEEPGWRGWLLPRWQQRFSPLVSAVLVWVPWALWHAPLDFTGSLGRTWVNYIQIRVVYFIAVSILMVWFYNHSRGSVLAVALFHASFNTFPFVLPYSPPLLGLFFVWAGYAVLADRMWRRPRARQPLQNSLPLDAIDRGAEMHVRVQ